MKHSHHTHPDDSSESTGVDKPSESKDKDMATVESKIPDALIDASVDIERQLSAEASSKKASDDTKLQSAAEKSASDN